MASTDLTEIPPGAGEDLVVVIENPQNLENIERIRKTCQLLGVKEVRIVYEKCPTKKELDVSGLPKTSVELSTFHSTAGCMSDLAGNGFTSIATALDFTSRDLYTLDMNETRKVAFWFGTEKDGLTPEALSAAPFRTFIPTLGMAQSLNVAISAAIILAESVRQRAYATGLTFQSPPVFDRCIAPDETLSSGYPLTQNDTQPYPPIAPARIQKFITIARQRQRGLIVVLVDPDRLDAAAILRSCDAFGVTEVHFIFVKDRPFDPLANRQVYKSQGSNLWVCSRVFSSVADCESYLSTHGYASVDVFLQTAEGAENVFKANLGDEQQLAFWYSKEAMSGDGHSAGFGHRAVCIPAAAGGQNLFISSNVSVILAETTRQRRNAPSPQQWALSPAEQKTIVDWCVAVHLKRHPNLENGGQAIEEVDKYSRLGHLRGELAAQGW